jgi:hypothetical protein
LLRIQTEVRHRLIAAGDEARCVFQRFRRVLEEQPAQSGYTEYNESAVPTIETPKSQEPKVDPHLPGARERVKAAAEELERLGIADSAGRRIRTDLPKDMQEGADRDFGGQCRREC